MMQTRLWLAVGLINMFLAAAPAIAHPHSAPFPLSKRERQEVREHRRMERQHFRQHKMMRRHHRMHQRMKHHWMMHERMRSHHVPMMKHKRFEMRRDFGRYGSI